ncbi:unnamed protein product [Durusdinium trenchii]|uniref:Uncharacterized protein n=3 Tax=Durusdinium trenchii TaxID=1381693 RepID=A0ABP0J216_9DINO
MPDASQAICIDSEEEAPAPPKKRKRVVQTAPQPVIVSCIDLDDEDKSDKVKHTKCNADAVCLSSDEEAPAIVIPQKPQTALHTLHTVPKEALCEDAVADEFERRAQDLADAALRNLSPAARAARMVKVKHSILLRLRQAAAECRQSEPITQPDPPACPPPPPEEPSEAQGNDAIALSAQKQQLQDWVERNQQRLQQSLVQGEQQRLEGEMQRQAAERDRLAEREKRKALWSTGASEGFGAGDGRLTANGWESSHFHSTKERLKFLRLMGGQKFVDAAQNLEGELDDEKVFELIAGEWVEAKEDDEEEEDFDIRQDAATVELLAGQWVDVHDAKEPNVHETECAERAQDLERQYLEGMSRQLGSKRLGLGAQ